MRGNTIGQLFRLTSFGESHGTAIGGVLDGCPAGLELDVLAVQRELDRRRPGSTPLGTARNEADRVEWLSGLFETPGEGSGLGETPGQARSDAQGKARSDGGGFGETLGQARSDGAKEAGVTVRAWVRLRVKPGVTVQREPGVTVRAWVRLRVRPGVTAQVRHEKFD